jgi:hypothetical protein
MAVQRSRDIRAAGEVIARERGHCGPGLRSRRDQRPAAAAPSRRRVVATRRPPRRGFQLRSQGGPMASAGARHDPLRVLLGAAGTPVRLRRPHPTSGRRRMSGGHAGHLWSGGQPGPAARGHRARGRDVLSDLRSASSCAPSAVLRAVRSGARQSQIARSDRARPDGGSSRNILPPLVVVHHVPGVRSDPCGSRAGVETLRRPGMLERGDGDQVYDESCRAPTARGSRSPVDGQQVPELSWAGAAGERSTFGSCRRRCCEAVREEDLSMRRSRLWHESARR